MAKLTQKQKLVKAFLFAQSVRSSASRFMRYCEDYNYTTGKSMAKDLQQSAEEFLNELQ